MDQGARKPAWVNRLVALACALASASFLGVAATARLVICIAIAAVAHGAALAADGVVTLSAGADFTSGNYGKSETTELAALQLGAKYESGRWVYRLTVPYLRISGPSNVIGVGADTIVLPGEVGDRRSVSGLGDVQAGVTYNLIGGSGALYLLDLGAKVKLATAEEGKGLGTGKNDFSIQADVLRPIGAFTPFATLGYRWYGDAPGTELRDAVFGALGLAYAESATSTVGMAYDFRQPIVAGGARVSELTLFMSHRLEREWKLQMYLVKGLADASPDAGVGVVLAYSF